MGYIVNTVLVATGSDEKFDKEMNAFIKKSFSKFKELKGIIGSYRGVNFVHTYVFYPSGSKSGWETENDAEGLREEFKEICHKHDVPVLSAAYGGDYQGLDVKYTGNTINEEEG